MAKTANNIERKRTTKRFACSHCPSTFGTSHHLKRHEQGHLGIQAFACQLCFKAFNRRDTLSRHMLTHEHLKEYRRLRACTECVKARTKCSKEGPCRRCIKKSLPCCFPTAGNNDLAQDCMPMALMAYSTSVQDDDVGSLTSATSPSSTTSFSDNTFWGNPVDQTLPPSTIREQKPDWLHIFDQLSQISAGANAQPYTSVPEMSYSTPIQPHSSEKLQEFDKWLMNLHADPLMNLPEQDQFSQTTFDPYNYAALNFG